MSFFSNEMLKYVLKCTNIHIYVDKVGPNYNREKDALNTCVRVILD